MDKPNTPNTTAAALILALLWLTPGRLTAALLAAAGKADVTPDLRKEKVWLAGYGSSGRKARGVHDALYARALLVKDERKTTAIVAVDSIGLFRGDILEMRRRLGWDGKDKFLFVSATHDHSAPDAMGLWGPVPGFSGVDPEYRLRLIDSVVSLVGRLESQALPAQIKAASRNLDPRGLCRDSRDPVVIDPELNAVQISRLGKPREVIATLLRWSCHPEVQGPDNLEVSADYPGALCAAVEARQGGTCVFQSGLVGGLMTPDVDHALSVPAKFEEIKRVGGDLAQAGLDALAGAAWHTKGKVAFAFRQLKIPVENSTYLLFLPNLAFGHPIYNAQGERLGRWRVLGLALRHFAFFPLPERARPWIETEVSRIRLGPAEFLGIPGEMFPELAIGGYDGRYRFSHPLFGAENPNPPRLARAPKGPYLKERKFSLILVGLANDELGYIVPEYDFQVTPSRSMLPHPKGTHYEETNSIGPSATRIILGGLRDLLKE
ncbi:MAG: hypothetical protein HY921_01035 [Elusimicrobia bacterium]|nr:hypothetical protein [Elusimicrobiota bacterium]